MLLDVLRIHPIEVPVDVDGAVALSWRPEHELGEHGSVEVVERSFEFAHGLPS